ncbi:NADPH oxidase 1 [Salpingoeca rosetta]|uniref:NADPH oxidase 1 n=1 Tax=Salpingoeca rosetta (strain ATCC 50818 / BSB-021) TaxID=946362 RepID=F2UIK7_SALR5|nr:NADPH oxidase 1 [Salpingoeca rosetta]EGD77056.1 NADPH oxidase 1 [Salpingoeca rosetta]|eukprot:XP_004990896.1 NADPH oxidase 1 [Salpingoeca rosetta]
MPLFGYYQGMTAKQWLTIEGPMYIFVAIWMLANVLLFVFTWKKYEDEEYTYLRHMTHKGLPTARGAASVLNLNCALVLLPVCRNLVNFCRGQFESKRSIRRLFDKNLLFHKWCAYIICLASAIHISAHVFNVHNLTRDTATYPPASGYTDIEALFTTVAGGTGIGITLSLILMVTTASPQIRRSYFELFWYTHHLFVVFYVCLCLHGSSGFVERQVNFDRVPFDEDKGRCQPRTGLGCATRDSLGLNPGQCLNTTNVEGVDDPSAFCCPCEDELEELQKGYPATWMWVIGPLVLYVLERIYRYYMCQTRRLSILKVVKHKDSVPVMEIQFQKVPTKAGQYVFLHCPKVSQLEWHPFTLTSCPELDYVSLHIRLVGDWTTALAEACGFYDDQPKRASELPSVAIDGPFGTSSEDLYHYPVAVCVGAGIGVTPFASLIQALYFRKSNPGKYPRFKTQKFYFYWICPGFDAWGWFANLLMDMEEKMAELGETSFFTVRVFMTRGWTKDDAAKLMLQENEEGDSIIRDAETGRCLKHKMNFGRPMWEKEFQSIADAHPGNNIGVFFCGPKVLSQELHRRSNQFTVQCSAQGTKFFYNKENF